MLNSSVKQLLLVVASAAILMSSSSGALADDKHRPRTTNINLAVASNFYGAPPSNSAITDLINVFEMDNPNYTVTAVDNGATATLESHIINGNKLKVDLFLAADTATLKLSSSRTSLTPPPPPSPVMVPMLNICLLKSNVGVPVTVPTLRLAVSTSAAIVAPTISVFTTIEAVLVGSSLNEITAAPAGVVPHNISSLR